MFSEHILDILADEQPFCRALNSGAQSINTATVTALTLDSDGVDRWGMHDTSTNTSRLTIVVSGTYVIWGSGTWADGTTGTRRLDLQLNGTSGGTRLDRRLEQFQLAGNVNQTVTRIQELIIGDYLEMYVNQDSGGAINFSSAELITCRVR